MGYRYRLNVKRLPGSPDLVFPGRRKVIFVHGCFWHGHPHCSKSRLPKTNIPYWEEKIRMNRARDERVAAELARDGWGVLVIWQCEQRDPEALAKKVEAFLRPE